MLQPETLFPYPGSYALYVDTDLPTEQQRAELVRIMWRREGHVSVSFPLRLNASGNKVVPAGELIDGTELSTEEAHEFHDLDRELAGRSMRTKRQKARAARRDTLKERMIYSRFLARRLSEARAIADRQRRAA